MNTDQTNKNIFTNSFIKRCHCRVSTRVLLVRYMTPSQLNLPKHFPNWIYVNNCFFLSYIKVISNHYVFLVYSIMFLSLESSLSLLLFIFVLFLLLHYKVWLNRLWFVIPNKVFNFQNWVFCYHEPFHKSKKISLDSYLQN